MYQSLFIGQYARLTDLLAFISNRGLADFTCKGELQTTIAVLRKLPSNFEIDSLLLKYH